MDLIDRLKGLATQISGKLEHLQTEEATKNALVMPFLNALGYNVFDPTEVVPEFTADVGTKRGEKVDYAILQDGKPIILIECKVAGTPLSAEVASQLYRYFSVTEARFGVLTDGVRYEFYSDLEEPNKMDARPFLEVNMLDLTEKVAAELKRFAKDSFDLERILSTASDLKFTKGIKKALAEEWMNPTEDFVRLLAGRVYSGRFTQAVREQFTSITRKAFHEFLSDRVNERLKSAMEDHSTSEEPEEDEEAVAGDGIVTTEDEWEGFYIVRAILSEMVAPQRVFMRDRKNYCAILLDDTNRKPICRLWFNTPSKSVGIFDAEKTEEKVPIDNTVDIYQHAARIKETVARYDGLIQEDEPRPSEQVPPSQLPS